MLGPIIKLNKSFDPDKLKESYYNVKEIRSVPAGYPGEGNVNWNSATLFSIGSTNNILFQIPYLGEALQDLNIHLRLARFMTLASGGIIKKHRDNFLSDNIFRLHIPIITDPEVEFYLDDIRCSWKEGEFWYGDFTKPHYGINKSSIERVHLVLDVDVDNNLLQLFPEEHLPELEKRLNSSSLIKTEELKRFECSFLLPKGFSIPGVEYTQLDVILNGNIKLIGKDLCLLINEQPMLKLIAVSEDKLALEGLGVDAYVEYLFDDLSIKELYLNVNGIKIPIETTHSKPD